LKTGNNELYADIYIFYYSFILSQHRTIIVLRIVRMYASTVLDLAKLNGRNAAVNCDLHVVSKPLRLSSPSLRLHNAG
jgi:hypothetical protein